MSVLPLALQLFPDMLDGLLGDMASTVARVSACRLRGRQASGTDIDMDARSLACGLIATLLVYSLSGPIIEWR